MATPLCLMSQDELSILYWFSHGDSVKMNYDTYRANVVNTHFKFYTEHNAIKLFIDESIPFISVPTPVRACDKSTCGKTCLFAKCSSLINRDAFRIPFACSYQHGISIQNRSKQCRCIVCGTKRWTRLRKSVHLGTDFYVCRNPLCFNIFSQKIAGTYVDELLSYKFVDFNVTKSAFKKF